MLFVSWLLGVIAGSLLVLEAPKDSEAGGVLILLLVLLTGLAFALWRFTEGIASRRAAQGSSETSRFMARLAQWGSQQRAAQGSSVTASFVSAGGLSQGISKIAAGFMALCITALYFVFYAGLVVGFLWVAVSLIRWLWQHPLF